MIARMTCYSSAIAGDCVVLKDTAGETVKVKSLSIPYADFARRVMRSRKAWLLVYAGPGSFHFSRR